MRVSVRERENSKGRNRDRDRDKEDKKPARRAVAATVRTFDLKCRVGFSLRGTFSPAVEFGHLDCRQDRFSRAGFSLRRALARLLGVVGTPRKSG
jgi:hypothetical protein